MPVVLRQPPGNVAPIATAQLEGQYSPGPEELMRRNAQEIVTLALDLEARGTKVILYQVPVAREIFDQIRYQNSRRIMREEVGEHTGLLMDLKMDDSELRWTDGAHLDERSSILVIRAMEKWLVEHSAFRDLGTSANDLQGKSLR